LYATNRSGITDPALHGRHKIVDRYRFRYDSMVLSRSGRQAEGIAANDDGPGADLGRPVRHVDAVSVGETPIGDHERIGLRIKKLLRLGGRRSAIDGVTRAAQAKDQQFAKLALVLNKENAFTCHLRASYHRAVKCLVAAPASLPPPGIGPALEPGDIPEREGRSARYTRRMWQPV
jgi:hypothetical protein